MLFVDEAYADFSGEIADRRRRFSRLPNLVVGRTFSKAYGIAGLRAGASSAHPRRWRRSRAGRAALQPERLGGRGAAGRASRTASIATGISSRRPPRARCCSRRATASGCRRGRARRTSCWSASATRASDVVVGARGARRPGPRSIAGARVRAVHPHHGGTGRRHATRHRRRSRRSCAPRGDRPADPRDVDRAEARPSKDAADTRSPPASASSITCSSSSPGMARFDLTLKATGDLDVDQHHTVEDVGIALGEAVSSAIGTRRGINRAGYFVMPMDETLAVAAIDLGGRPHAVVDLQLEVRARRRSAVRAGAGLLRGVRAGRARQRPREGALRTIESSPGGGRLQGVCARAARRLLEGPAARTHAARRRKDCCDCDRPDRLRGREPDVGAEGARARPVQTLYTPSAPADLARRGGHRDSRRRPLRGHAGARRADGARRSSPRSADGAVLGICLGLQFLFEGSDRGARRAGARPASRRCTLLPASPGLKVPHVGWNALAIRRTSRLLDGLDDGTQVYFTHSYAAPVTRGDRRDDRARRAVRGRCRARPMSSASSSTRRSPVEAGLRILRSFVQISRFPDSQISKSC